MIYGLVSGLDDDNTLLLLKSKGIKSNRRYSSQCIGTLLEVPIVLVVYVELCRCSNC